MLCYSKKLLPSLCGMFGRIPRNPTMQQMFISTLLLTYHDASRYDMRPSVSYARQWAGA